MSYPENENYVLSTVHQGIHDGLHELVKMIAHGGCPKDTKCRDVTKAVKNLSDEQKSVVVQKVYYMMSRKQFGSGAPGGLKPPYLTVVRESGKILDLSWGACEAAIKVESDLEKEKANERVKK